MFAPFIFITANITRLRFCSQCLTTVTCPIIHLKGLLIFPKRQFSRISFPKRILAGGYNTKFQEVISHIQQWHSLSFVLHCGQCLKNLIEGMSAISWSTPDLLTTLTSLWVQFHFGKVNTQTHLHFLAWAKELKTSHNNIVANSWNVYVIATS